MYSTLFFSVSRTRTPYYGSQLIYLQNGNIEEVKKIVTMLNEAEVPSEDVVGKFAINVMRSSFLVMSSETI